MTPIPWTYRGWDGRHPPAPILVRLHGWLRGVDPGGRFLGIAPSAAHHAASPLSLHESGRALDWGPSSREEGEKLADLLTRWPDGAQVQLVLWRGRQWGGRRGPRWVTVGGHAHDDHLHIETRGYA